MDEEVTEIEEPNRMYVIDIGIRDGENEYHDEVYYFGKREDAERYADSYLNDYWGIGETEYDNIDEVYYNNNETLGAWVYGVYEFDTVVAMTEKGTLAYKTDWRLK